MAPPVDCGVAALTVSLITFNLSSLTYTFWFGDRTLASTAGRNTWLTKTQICSTHSFILALPGSSRSLDLGVCIDCSTQEGRLGNRK